MLSSLCLISLTTVLQNLWININIQVGYFRDSTLTGLSAAEEELAMMEGETKGGSVTSIKRLGTETTSTAFPSSKMLNIVMRSLLLEETDYSVMAAAHSYLNSFLFLHLRAGSKDRDTWLILILSAFRKLESEMLFKKFDLTNSKDVYTCWFFLKEVMEKIEERAFETKDEDPEEEKKEESLLGPFLLLDFLTKMLEKDFWIWWREWRTPIESDHVTFPLFFYIFGGDSKNVLHDLKKSLLSCYKSLLPQEHWALPNLRKLLGLAALLVSYLDLCDNYGALFWGDKRSLAILVAEVFESLYLPAERVYIELSLIQPSWFSVMVSHRWVNSFLKC